MDAAAENKIRANEAAFEKDMAEPRSRQAMALQMGRDAEDRIQAMLHGETPDGEEFKGRLGKDVRDKMPNAARGNVSAPAPPRRCTTDVPSLGGAKRRDEQRKWVPRVPHRPFATSAREQRVRELSLRHHLAIGGRLDPFIEKRPQSLRPLLSSNGEWEWVEAILDSGATVTVIPPHVGVG